MKNFQRLFSIILLLYSLLYYHPSVTHAWYGAGSTSGWDISTPGIKGSVAVEPRKSPQLYQEGESISIEFILENITDTFLVDLPLYLHVLKITQSPLSQYISDVQSSQIIELSDEQLRTNTIQGNDRQMPYQTIKLGSIQIAPHTSASIPVHFSVSTPGYYQYDLTSYPNSSEWNPGYIYAAGYLRILPTNVSSVFVEPLELSKDTTVLPSIHQDNKLAMSPRLLYTIPYAGLLPLCTNNPIPYIFWVFIVCTISSAVFIENKRLSLLSIVFSGLGTYISVLISSLGCVYDSNILTSVTLAICLTSIVLSLLKIFTKSKIQLHPIQIFI